MRLVQAVVCGSAALSKILILRLVHEATLSGILIMRLIQEVSPGSHIVGNPDYEVSTGSCLWLCRIVRNPDCEITGSWLWLCLIVRNPDFEISTGSHIVRNPDFEVSTRNCMWLAGILILWLVQDATLSDQILIMRLVQDATLSDQILIMRLVQEVAWHSHVKRLLMQSMWCVAGGSSLHDNWRWILRCRWCNSG